MSISSCPRCAEQITIPAGVSTTAKVRCPLCQAQYTLADALAKSPPMLEVIDQSEPDWLTPQAAPVASADAPTEPSLDDELAFEAEPALDPRDESGTAGFGTEDKDTDIEAPHDLEPLAAYSADEETLAEFQRSMNDADKIPPQPAAADEEFALEFEVLQPAADASGNEEVALDFGAAEEVEDEVSTASTIEFSEFKAAQGAKAEDEMELDFGEPLTSEASEDATIEFQGAFTPGDNASEEVMDLDFGEPQPEGEAAANPFDHRLEPSAGGGEEIELDFGEASAVPAAAMAGDDSPEETARPGKKDKKKKKKKEVAADDGTAPKGRSLVGSLVSVLLGAIVAVPLALYVVMWLGPDYDFLNVGRKLASWYVPLPPAFSKPSPGKMMASVPPAIPQAPPSQPAPQTRGDDAPPAAPDNNAPPADTAAAEPAPRTPPADSAPVAANDPAPAPSAPPPANEPAPSPSATVDNPPAEAPPATAAKPEEMPADTPADLATEKPQKPATEPEPITAAKPVDKADDSLEDLLKSPEPTKPPTADEPPTLADEPMPEPDLLGPTDAPAYTAADLAKAMQDASAASDKFQAAQTAKDEAAVKSTRAKFYLTFFRLAEALTFARDADKGQLDSDRTSIEQVMHQFASDKKRVESLKFNATKWLEYGKRTTPGIAIAGNVQSAEPVGKLFEVKLAIGSSADGPTVTVVQRTDPSLQAGDQAFVLGAIVDNPAERLIGYDGDAPMAIWSGMTLKLPAAE